MTWQDYESTVRNIYESLGRSSGVVIECHGAGCRRIGKSGVSHQVDVLTSHSDGVHTYYTAIECKYWSQKVDKDIVMKVMSINGDCNFDKSVIVSKEGFTDDAVLTAKYTNVHLVELKEANFSISGDILTKFFVHLETAIPVLTLANIRIDGKYSGKYDGHPLLAQNPFDALIRKKDGTILAVSDLITVFLNDNVLKHQSFDVITEQLNMGVGSTLKSNKVKGSIPMWAIDLSGYRWVFTRIDPDYFASRVWLLMHLLFEKKGLAVTFDGQVVEIQARDPLELGVGQNCTVTMKLTAKKFLIKSGPGEEGNQLAV